MRCTVCSLATCMPTVLPRFPAHASARAPQFLQCSAWGGITPGEQTCPGAARWGPRRLQAQMRARLLPGRRPQEQLLPPLLLEPQTGIRALQATLLHTLSCREQQQDRGSCRCTGHDTCQRASDCPCISTQVQWGTDARGGRSGARRWGRPGCRSASPAAPPPGCCCGTSRPSGMPVMRYSTARSGLWNAARKARTTSSRGKAHLTDLHGAPHHTSRGRTSYFWALRVFKICFQSDEAAPEELCGMLGAIKGILRMGCPAAGLLIRCMWSGQVWAAAGRA